MLSIKLPKIWEPSTKHKSAERTGQTNVRDDQYLDCATLFHRNSNSDKNRGVARGGQRLPPPQLSLKPHL